MQVNFLLDPTVNHAFYLEMLAREGIDAGPVKTSRLKFGLDIGKLVLTPEEQGHAIVTADSVRGYTECVTNLVTERLEIWQRCLLDSYPWYLESVWPTHRARLNQTVEQLQAYLAPGQPGEAGLLSMSEILETPWPEDLAVHLIAERHSAMSQGVPPIISIYKHKFERLLDIIFHELLHIIVDRPSPHGVSGRLRAELEQRGIPDLAIRDIEHSLVFAFSAETARRYLPGIRRVKPYHKAIPVIRTRYAEFFRIYSTYQFPRRSDRLSRVSQVAAELARAWGQLS